MNKLSYVIVFVSDMNRSVAFYRDALGLPLKFESPHWTEFATDGTTLALHMASAEPAGPPPGELIPPAYCQPGFTVQNLDEFHARVTAEGVRCIRPPKALEFGGRLAVYADPDGLPISVAEM